MVCQLVYHVGFLISFMASSQPFVAADFLDNPASYEALKTVIREVIEEYRQVGVFLGEKGHQGIPGTKGSRGLPGDDGTPGYSGHDGLPGGRGDKGDIGSPGSNGQQGVQGTKGSRGLPGVDGKPGDSGRNGLPGGKGDKGPQGPNGPKGVQGTKGNCIPGTKGSRGLPGSDGTPGDSGHDGLSGAKGDKGDIGSPGPNGQQGVQGTKGNSIQGTKGSRGLPGVDGKPGDSGRDGLPGGKGDKGPQGPNGPKGVQGTKGNSIPGTKGSRRLPGWTVIQRRGEFQPRENFYRVWADYVRGFGYPDKEFWLGLEAMHEITSEAEFQLHILLEDWEGNTRFALYRKFHVGSAEDNYKLTITGYSGDAGDAMAFHNGQAFSTRDNDNDSHSSANCVEVYQGAWWYNSCAHANLNGVPDKAMEGGSRQGIVWYPWLGFHYSLRSVTMKIRTTI